MTGVQTCALPIWVLELTEGRGADVIYDPVGGEFAGATVTCLASRGRLLAIGFASGSWAQADVGTLTLRNASIMGVYVGAYDAEQRGAAHTALLDLYRQGLLKPVPGESVHFLDLPRAVGAVDRHEVSGKLVVTVKD